MVDVCDLSVTAQGNPGRRVMLYKVEVRWKRLWQAGPSDEEAGYLLQASKVFDLGKCDRALLRRSAGGMAGGSHTTSTSLPVRRNF